MHKKEYRIGELAELAEVTRRTIHYYIHKELLPPAKGAGVNSYYTADHLNRIKLIRKLQESYLPLAEIRKIIAPLSPTGVLEYLEQHRENEQPLASMILVQEPAQEMSYRTSSTPILYERVELGENIELHFPGELREIKPELLRSLIENCRRIIDHG